MQFDKQQILEMLQQHGSSEQVSQAEQDLPDQVDTDQHAGLLSKLGVNPQELLTKTIGGGGAGGLGGLGTGDRLPDGPARPGGPGLPVAQHSPPHR